MGSDLGQGELIFGQNYVDASFIFLRQDTPEMRRCLLEAWQSIRPQISMECMNQLVTTIPVLEVGVSLGSVLHELAERAKFDRVGLPSVVHAEHAFSGALKQLRI